MSCLCNYEVGKGESITKTNLPFIDNVHQKGPLLMGVPSWWSVGCEGSDDCTCLRGCVGGAILGFAIVGCVILGRAIIEDAIIGGAIIGIAIIGSAIIRYIIIGSAMQLAPLKSAQSYTAPL